MKIFMRSCKRAILTITIAAAITLLLTPLMNKARHYLPHNEPSFLSSVLGVTTLLDEFLGIGPVDPMMGIPPECLDDPAIARFLKTLKERIQPLLGKPGSRYYARMVVGQHVAEGWPYKTRARCTRVIVTEYRAGAWYCAHILLADEKGEPPERPEGRKANWIFYSCVSIPSAWLIVRLRPIRRLRRMAFETPIADPVDEH